MIFFKTFFLEIKARPYLVWGALAWVIFVTGTSWVALQLYNKPYDDLPSFYWATWLALQEGLSVYQYAYLSEIGSSLDRKIYPFLYPPISVLLFSPFLLCDEYAQCKSLFSVFNVSLSVLAAAFLYRLYYWQEKKYQSIALWVIPIFCFLFAPIADTFRTGQINLIALLCLAPIFFSPTGRRQQVCAGILLACAIVLKIYLVLLLAVLLLFGRWREIFSCVGALLFLILIGAVILPEPMWLDWLALAESSGYGKRVPHLLTIPFNQSINGFFVREFLGQASAKNLQYWVVFIYAGVLICILPVAWVSFKCLRYWPSGCSALLALTLLLVNLIAPLTWLHHYVFTLPAIVWTSVLLLQSKRSVLARSMVGVLFVWGVLLIGMPYLGGVLLASYLALSAQLVGALAIFLAFLVLVFQTGDESALQE